MLPDGAGVRRGQRASSGQASLKGDGVQGAALLMLSPTIAIVPYLARHLIKSPSVHRRRHAHTTAVWCWHEVQRRCRWLAGWATAGRLKAVTTLAFHTCCSVLAFGDNPRG